MGGRVHLDDLILVSIDDHEVAVFVGKNPWQSHSMPHARPTLREIASQFGFRSHRAAARQVGREQSGDHRLATAYRPCGRHNSTATISAMLAKAVAGGFGDTIQPGPA